MVLSRSDAHGRASNAEAARLGWIVEVRGATTTKVATVAITPAHDRAVRNDGAREGATRGNGGVGVHRAFLKPRDIELSNGGDGSFNVHLGSEGGVRLNRVQRMNCH